MVAENLLQGIVQQVGCGMIGSGSVALVGIDACHELGSGILRQLLDDMYALVVFALGIDDVDGLVLVAEYTAITNLSTHLTIEWCGVEHELVELVLLLGDLAITQDVAVVFGVVVAYELLFTSLQLRPVAVLDGSGITGTLLLLLHLDVELILIDGEAILATDEFREVEGETVGIEHTESLNTIQLVLALSLEICHSFIEQGDTFIECAQEAVFLLLDNLGNQLLLSLQFREGIAHLMNEGGDELIEEAILLSEEGISIAYGTA